MGRRKFNHINNFLNKYEWSKYEWSKLKGKDCQMRLRGEKKKTEPDQKICCIQERQFKYKTQIS